jgi:hypothetical protein
MLLTLCLYALCQRSSSLPTPLYLLFQLAKALDIPTLKGDPQDPLLVERRETRYRSALKKAALVKNSIQVSI